MLVGSKDMQIETVTLKNGVSMPLLGMGTFSINKWALSSLIRNATKLGVRSIDTASAYHNEAWTGLGLKLSPVKRRDLFVTTKLSNGQQRNGDVEKALKLSLLKLGTRYVDLYLMHWPQTGTYLECWKQMEALYEKGYARAIGVCNFHQHHFDELFKIADVKPMVNQVELHPLLTQKELIRYCRGHEIQVEAYSPLARMHDDLINNKVLVDLAYRYRKSVVQIVLRWNYQNRVPVIPKSNQIERIAENLSIINFDLQDTEMLEIDGINKNMRVRHDPDNCDFSKL